MQQKCRRRRGSGRGVVVTHEWLQQNVTSVVAKRTTDAAKLRHRRRGSQLSHKKKDVANLLTGCSTVGPRS